MTEKDFICIGCGGTKVSMLYSSVGNYRCDKCGKQYKDANAYPAIRVLTLEQAQAKRPKLYDLPICSVCDHQAHPDSKCNICIADQEESLRPVNLIPDEERAWITN